VKRVYQVGEEKSKSNQRGMREGAIPLPLPLAAVMEDWTEAFESFCVETGLVMIRALLAEEVEGKAGARYRHDPKRAARRNGHQAGYMVVFGQKVPLWRERVQDREGREVALERYRLFQSEGRMQRQVGKLLTRKLSTRDYEGAVELLAEGYGVKKSSVSRHWKRLTAGKVRELCERRLDERDWVVLEVDSKEFGEWTVTVALGVDSSGHKQVLGLWQGSSENSAVCVKLFEDLIERGLDPERPRLYVLDGSRALKKAVRKVFGEQVPIQRCQAHKRRNVKAHLPLEHQAEVDRRLLAAYGMRGYEEAKKSLELTVRYLQRLNPKAAESLKEGLEETLTLHRLGVPAELRKSFSSTNLIESCFSITQEWTRRAKRWRNGEMVWRWAGAALLEAERRFRRVKGYRSMALFLSLLTKNLDHEVKVA
jgi:putative transposase